MGKYPALEVDGVATEQLRGGLQDGGKRGPLGGRLESY